jgi:hypothetical protein
MKITYFLPFLFFYCIASSQPSQIKNIFIITTDGFRWQEVFTGADSAIMNDTEYVQDTALIKDLYWDPAAGERRKKLMPFFWNVIAKEGQLYGNRLLHNNVNVKNLYKISFPGYNEILTGYADPLLIPNLRINNRNKNILDYFNSQESYKGKVVAFASWNMFPSILNKKRSRIYLNSGYDSATGGLDITDDMINATQGQVSHKGHTRYDLLTSIAAKEYIHRNHPRIVFMSFGETDEFAHQNRYDLYLEQATNIDKMIEELWYAVQTDPFYKDNTIFIITTDHGRGQDLLTWHGHNGFIKGSGDTWLAIMGPGIKPLGEMEFPGQIYQNQLAATIALLMGEKFVTAHKIGKPFLSNEAPVPASATASFFHQTSSN